MDSGFVKDPLSESLLSACPKAISVESIRFSAPICFSVPIQFCTAVVRFALVPRLRSGAVRGPTVSSQRQTIYAAKATTASYGCQRLWRKISSTAPPEHSLLSLFSGRMSLAVTGGYWALGGIHPGGQRVYPAGTVSGTRRFRLLSSARRE